MQLCKRDQAGQSVERSCQRRYQQQAAFCCSSIPAPCRCRHRRSALPLLTFLLALWQVVSCNSVNGKRSEDGQPGYGIQARGACFAASTPACSIVPAGPCLHPSCRLPAQQTAGHTLLARPTAGMVQGEFDLSLSADGLLAAALMTGLMLSAPASSQLSRHFPALRLMGFGLGWVGGEGRREGGADVRGGMREAKHPPAAVAALPGGCTRVQAAAPSVPSCLASKPVSHSVPEGLQRLAVSQSKAHPARRQPSR